MATRKKTAGKSKKKLIIFAVELIIILAMIGVLYLVMRTTDNEGYKYTVLDKSNLGTVDLSSNKGEETTTKGDDGTVTTTTKKKYMNIALFGVDAQNEKQLYKGSRSDSIMVASINLETGDIKLCSVYRDTYLNIGSDYRKCNAAYSYGGAEQAIRMLNMNLDLDIENFVTVGYKGLSEVINGLGGVYIDVDSEELKHINNYQIDVAKVLGCDYTPVKSTGYQLLDGLQATAYCRIRYTSGDDFKRTARQREVIKAIEEQAKKANVNTLLKVFENASSDIYTSIDSDDIIELLKNITNYRIVDENGFPQENMRTVANIGAKGSSVIPLDLVSNVQWLHEFLFDDSDYQVTDTVKEYGNKIKSDTSSYIN